MTPGCYMAKLDIANMYLTLGLSVESRKHFGFINQGRKRRYSPKGCLSELNWVQVCWVHLWLRSFPLQPCFEGVHSVVNYMDDFFVVGLTYASCLFNLACLTQSSQFCHAMAGLSLMTKQPALLKWWRSLEFNWTLARWRYQSNPRKQRPSLLL